MKVGELIEWLQTLPPDSPIVIEDHSGYLSQIDTVERVNHPSDCSGSTHFTGFKITKEAA